MVEAGKYEQNQVKWSTEMTEMIKFSDKNVKTTIINMFNKLITLEESVNIMEREIEDTVKEPRGIWGT